MSAGLIQVILYMKTVFDITGLLQRPMCSNYFPHDVTFPGKMPHHTVHVKNRLKKILFDILVQVFMKEERTIIRHFQKIMFAKIMRGFDLCNNQLVHNRFVHRNP